ncbi:hypothetical protein ILUMI_20761 [Ignelater luminosus]|uniref:Uncharacterized protein n=1 Tax=Ignelater luminosus TaxID=2038154 RepID=A0A8K0CHV3_IGNLU|nr:hypothetical protein ILUMI_20761 [Ignelater luminosus]
MNCNSIIVCALLVSLLMINVVFVNADEQLVEERTGRYKRGLCDDKDNGPTVCDQACAFKGFKMGTCTPDGCQCH